MRTSGKILRLILYVAGLMLVLLPGTALAQDEKTGISLTLIPGDYYKEVIPGEENILHLEVHNTGDKPVTNIRLSAEEPEGWYIEFSPAVIGYLNAGSLQTVDIAVTPAKNPARGEHRIHIIAEANETRKITTAFLKIEPATSIWTWIGVAIAAIVIAGFFFVYRRFGQ